MSENLQSEPNIFEQLAQMHNGPRVLFNEVSGGISKYANCWQLTRAEDIRMVLKRTDLFSNQRIAQYSRLFGETWDLLPLEKDPPEHGKYRAVMNGAFAPAKVMAMRDRMRDRVRRLIDAFVDDGECEFIAAFARPFPVAMFMQIMGLPESDMERLNAWEHDLLHSKDPQERADGARGLGGYIRDLVQLRRREPANDMTTLYINAQIDGRPTTDEEVVGMCFMVLSAGLDTVAASLGLHFRHLAMFPSDQDRLRNDPSLIPGAVEEFLRAYAIVTTNRWVTQDTEIGGVKLKAGDRILLSTQVANLDPAEFENPTVVDINRSPNPHFTFGGGQHRCLGSHLARIELNIAMEEFLKAVPSFRLAKGAQVRIEAGSVCSIPELRLAWCGGDRQGARVRLKM